MAGVGRLVYYTSAFMVDVIEFLIPAIILIILCAVSEVMRTFSVLFLFVLITGDWLMDGCV